MIKEKYRREGEKKNEETGKNNYERQIKQVKMRRNKQGSEEVWKEKLNNNRKNNK